MGMLLLINFSLTAMMVGVIWMVQLVQYPLFAAVSETRFRDFHEGHSRRISWIVAPLMSAELGSALSLAVWYGGGLAWAAFGLASVTWLSTALLSLPLHDVLGLGFSERAHQALVRTNWVRTIAWSTRLVVVATLVWSHFAHIS